MFLNFLLQMLKEVGFQAGQHEVIAEAFSKDYSKGILKQTKELREARRQNKKESEQLIGALEQAFSAMQISKEKFRKALEDQERAIQAYRYIINFVKLGAFCKCSQIENTFKQLK